MFVAIVKTENNRIAKFAEFETAEEATDHVAKFGGRVLDNTVGTRLEDLYIGDDTVTVVPREAGTEDVRMEAHHRLEAGFDYDFGDARGVHRIGTTEADLRGWDEVSTYAFALALTGDMTTLITIETDTGTTQVTSLEWLDVLKAAAAIRQNIWNKSFEMQKAKSRPSNVEDDKHWK